MKQVIQYLTSGNTDLIESPEPRPTNNNLLVRSHMSLISPGTERMITDFAKANFLGKLKKQPERLQEVLDKTRTDGLIETFNAVSSKLDQPLPLGYSNVGTVIHVGSNCKDFSVGDRVLSNGYHSEIISTSQNLCALIPENVSDQEAVFTVLASIGLQGIRLASPSLGESFLVSGLGIIGLLTCQLLKANGCDVLAIDTNNQKCKIAKNLGIKSLVLSENVDTLDWIKSNTKGIGVDGALIAASTTSSDPIHQAAIACRKKGRIIMIGSTGMKLNRDDFYKKEISFQVSCSYGPGRYDHAYEIDGHDYPIGYVRWTEKRNFESVLNLMSEKLLNVDELISHKFSIEDAAKAYALLASDEEKLGIILKYKDHATEKISSIELKKDLKYRKDINKEDISLSFIGAGNYASRVLIPAFKNKQVIFNTLSANTGLNSLHYGKKYSFKNVSTDIDEVINNKEVDAIVISTRHDSHAELVIKALKARKHIFVEKPLCINSKELESIESAYNKINTPLSENKILMVGYNRRYAPLLIKLKEILSNHSCPKAFVYTCNAGPIPADHWTQKKEIGGGRLIGEACHFIDLIRFLACSPIKNIHLESLSGEDDTFSMNISFEDGSIGTIHYFSNGNKKYQKERIEVFSNNEIFSLNNFKNLDIWNSRSGHKKINNFRQDKGQKYCTSAFINAIRSGGEHPIPINEIFEVQRKILKTLSR